MISAQKAGQDSLPPSFFFKDIFNFDILDRVCSKVSKHQQASLKKQVHLLFHTGRFQLLEYFIFTKTSAFKSYLLCARSRIETQSVFKELTFY